MLQAARCFTAQSAPQRVAEEQRGGRRWPITVISLLGITGVFMGVDPSTFSANLAGTLRALNDYLPAHTDPDGHWEVTNLYFRGTAPGPQRQGCVLHVADGSRGGRVSTHPTDPGNPMRVRQVDFCPTEVLHWVESQPGTEAHRDEGSIRYIPFDNVWLASKILGEGSVGVRLAPREPLVRDAIVCSMCGLHVGSPADNPAYWVNQFGAAVQRAVGAPAFTCYDCMRSPMESEWSPWFRV